MADFLRTYTELARILSAPNNPLTQDEYQRLTRYIALARGGGPFTPEQVRDYQAIIRKLEEEKPLNRDIWPLVALGALLLGMYLLGKREQ